MRVEDYLNQAHRLDKRIEFKMRELEDLRATVADIHSSALGERVQTSRSADPPFVRALERIEEAQEKIEQEVETLVRLKAQINDVISSVRDADEQTVLRYRYIRRMTWSDIAFEMNTSEKTARRRNASALCNVVLPDDAIFI